ncbi:uncharacterized protein JCM6883_003794 [Sporobolomyces salmoneus]|uniref:uncharacterized protein n=1 Tax=Sporobolomyces salmoneus TaxID=183962 RepID=UPI00316C21ED
MNTVILPPELLSIIVQHAAECDSTHDSYKKRLGTLSALSLVNRTFREIAQPLLVQKVVCRNPDELLAISDTGVTNKVRSLTYGEVLKFSGIFCSMGQFVNLTRLRVMYRSFDLQRLGEHQRESSLLGRGYRMQVLISPSDLATLAIESCSLSGWTDLILPQLVELSIEWSDITLPTVPSGEGSVDLFSTERFPSLRALALKNARLAGQGVERPPVDYSLACRLDCIVADRVYPLSNQPGILQTSSPYPSLGYPVPFLFELDPHRDTTSWGWGRLPLPFDPSILCAHVRIRLPCKSTPDPSQVETALSLAKALLVHSTALKELYLDLFPRNGKGGYVLGEDLEDKIMEFEDQATKKNVEIIWETHEEDWCRSLVSKEFWRRSRENRRE